jgi:CDP-glucose 4,6-dehydratase
MFGSIYSGKRVLVTGHTGFKGSWLCLWLQDLGAEVFEYALEPEITPSHYELAPLEIHSEIADIRDCKRLLDSFSSARPDIVFHLAAQPYVRRSYAYPIETMDTNIMGTANVLEACRQTGSVRAAVIITSDKCYENREWVWGYRENDPMGGFDPYSASKGCAELVAASWRNSFFHPDQFGKTHHTLVASARAGNVIGGGDWGEDRLIPDLVRAAEARKTVVIRSPRATRPWQHVLEPLIGCLLLGQRLLEGRKDCAEAFNFGPAEEGSITVDEVVRRFKAHWDGFEYELKSDPDQPHEAGLLKLDCSKARSKLDWHPLWDAAQALEKTAAWYKNYYLQNSVCSLQNLEEYIQLARKKGICWATVQSENNE